MNARKTPAKTDWILNMGALRGNGGHDFDTEPSRDDLARLVADFGLVALNKLRFKGRLEPEGRRDWVLKATLGATVVQTCVASLEQVTTRIDAPVFRQYLADMPEEPTADETEMPDIEDVDPLPATLDLLAVVTEALALHVPQYPRADSADAVDETFSAPGVTPMSAEDAKPFAALAALKGKLSE